MHASPATDSSGIDHFHLENGLEIVVIPDRRAPVVTHMVYYRNGAADDPQGKSGIAHFLEHLMFKGTDANPKGVFSEIVSELGGQENAFTSYDYTAYYQRIAKEHLGRMMALESDRMTGLVLQGPEVLSERDVVIEERKMRTDSDPSALLQEAMLATLYVHHPYGTPIIGWGHEIEGLSREDALAYYRRFYRPENAILIVAGDVDRAEVERLARETYGRIPPSNAGKPERNRVIEPPVPAERLVRHRDAKVEQPMTEIAWLAPCYRLAQGNDAHALDVANQLLGGSITSRLYRTLVVEKGIAVSAKSWYWNDALDMGQFGVYATPAEGVSLDDLDAALHAVIRDLAENPVSETEFTRAKTRLVADMVYAQDSQAHLARMYGATLTTGGTVQDVREWPAKIEAVTIADVQRVLGTYILGKPPVTGHLLKAA